MKKILIILTGVLLVYGEPVLANNELTGIAIARKISKSVKKTSQKKKKVKSAKKVLSKNKKKVVSKKKIQKKRKKVVQTRIKYNISEIQSYTYSLVKSYGWSDYDWECLVKLWNRESSWNPNAVNKKSGACGIPQANPCSKASKGTDYRTNWKTQVRWGLNYIKKRYGTPSEAWKHSQDIGWY